jgi:hypothetical protein
VHSEFQSQIEELTAEYQALDARRSSLYQGIEDLLRERAPYLRDIEWPEPANGDEHPDPLFDSSRDYVTQIDRYKQHQGKLTTRKPGRRGPGKRSTA